MNSENEYALDLFVGQVFVARLEFHPEQDTFSLAYSPTWASDRRGYALSPHLPLDGKATSSSIRRFLENLLPEGRALDVASVHSNIQKNNIFGLVRYLGKETTGAVTFLSANQTPQALVPQFRELPAFGAARAHQAPQRGALHGLGWQSPNVYRRLSGQVAGKSCG